jgi:xanthine dehydrogenase accessory factor
MMPNIDTIIPKTISIQLKNDHPVVLVSVVDIQGSSPRHKGAKMVVTSDGKNCGTIGGSLFEAKAIQEARHVLITGKSKFMDFSFDDGDALPSGMICGGKAIVLIDYISPNKQNIELFDRWDDSIQEGTAFYLLIHFHKINTRLKILGHALLFRGGKIVGNPSLSAVQLKILNAEKHDVPTATTIALGDTQVIMNLIKKLQTLYCFGAGHVAIPTAHIAALAGFRVVILDDRAEFANTERFPDAEQILVINSYKAAFKGLEIGKDSFIVIMTRGHQYDQMVLEQALKTPAHYIGMISSRKKRDTIYQELLTKGIQKQELERVHSPVGIDIGSETPEEIAVSIVAQLIKERSKITT